VLNAENRRMLGKLAVVTLGMFGFGFALVPMYDKICEVTGINAGAEQVLAANTQVDTARSVRLEFDANINGTSFEGDVPWTFKPVTRTIEVHPGQLMQVEYVAENPTASPVTARAIPSYGPARAASYFKKIECFCFTEQTLQPGEVKRMPVMFVVDRNLPEDIHTITLSYTFFRLDAAKEAQAAGGQAKRG
jgi:cytochrome c oxidase assembly protein subunit 11